MTDDFPDLQNSDRVLFAVYAEREILELLVARFARFHGVPFN